MRKLLRDPIVIWGSIISNTLAGVVTLVIMGSLAGLGSLALAGILALFAFERWAVRGTVPTSQLAEARFRALATVEIPDLPPPSWDDPTHPAFKDFIPEDYHRAAARLYCRAHGHDWKPNGGSCSRCHTEGYRSSLRRRLEYDTARYERERREEDRYLAWRDLNPEPRTRLHPRCRQV